MSGLYITTLIIYPRVYVHVYLFIPHKMWMYGNRQQK